VADRGAQATSAGHAGQEGPGHPGRAGQPCPQTLGAGRLTGDDGGARGRPGRGPTGPGSHRGGSGDVGVAGDGLVAAQSRVAASVFRGEMATPAMIPAIPS
jgi:hypothetical protein